MRAFLSALPLALALFACKKDEEEVEDTDVVVDTDTTDTTDTTDPMGDDTIIGVATEAGDFTTLLAAVDAAGLTETLQSAGPFTVFAPTDDAFNALPAGTVEALLADIPTLTDILLYHVVSGSVGSDVVVGESLVTTLQGSDIKVTVDGASVFLNDAQITITDIEASNGLIHVIDAVLLPPPSIATIVATTPNLSTLLAAVDAAGLVETLDGDGPFTLFAPTNDAFAALPAGTVEALLADIPALTNILLYHVVAESLTAAEVLAAPSVSTVQGTEAQIRLQDGKAYIDGAEIIVTDIPAGNGTVHIINGVMLP